MLAGFSGWAANPVGCVRDRAAGADGGGRSGGGRDRTARWRRRRQAEGGAGANSRAPAGGRRVLCPELSVAQRAIVGSAVVPVPAPTHHLAATAVPQRSARALG